MSDVERQLARVMRRRQAVSENLRDLDAERDELILKAMDDRIPRSRIIELTGLSRQRLDQIRQAARAKAA